MKRVQCIYQIKNTVNNKVYVGSSINFYVRKSDHIRTLNKGVSKSYKLQYSWSKYGKDSFEFSILELVDQRELIYEREEFWIVKLDSVKNGYNIVLPHTRNYNINTLNTVLEKQKDWLLTKGPHNLKQMSKEEWIAKRKEDPNFTVKPKNENSLTKEELKVQRSIPISCYDMSFKLLNTYPSIREAARVLDIPPTEILCSLKKNGVCNFGKKLLNRRGYIFIKSSLVNDNTFVGKIKPSKVIKPYNERSINRLTISLTKDGEVKDFVSLTEAAKYIGCTYGNLVSLKNGIKNKGGGKFTKVTHIKGWSIHSSTSV